MGKHNNNALIVFARDPIMGQVKTRLNPFLDLQAICDLYTCFLFDSLNKMCAVKSTDRFVGVYPSNLSGYFERLDLSTLSVPVLRAQEDQLVHVTSLALEVAAASNRHHRSLP